MANVTVLMFDDLDGAESMLQNMNSWQGAGWVTVEDAVVVTRRPGNNTLDIKQTRKVAGKWALGGTGFGLIAGLLLGGPIGGAVAGAAIGGVSGALKDYGINDKFIKQIGEGLRPGTSALFLMTSGGDEEKLMAELRPHKATVLSTTLPSEQEQRLRRALERQE